MNYILCLLSSTFIAVNSIFIKQYQKRTSKIKNADYIFNAILSLIAAVFYAITGVLSDGLSVSMEFIPHSCLYAVGYVIGTVGYLCAVSRGSLLITVIMGQMGCLIPILFSLVIYKDQPTPTMVAGMFLLMVALLLFHMQKKRTEKTKPFFWLFSFMNFFGNGIALLSIKVQQYEQPGKYQSGMLFYGILLAAVAFIVIVALKPPKNCDDSDVGCAKVLVRAGVWACLYGIFNGGANYLNANVISRLPTIAFYMCVTGFGILLSFIISRFIYREKLLVHQYLGCCVATVGLILLMAF